MADVEIDLDRMVLVPGENLTGTLHCPQFPDDPVELTLRGEESFRPYVGWSSTKVTHEQIRTVQCVGGEASFELDLPDYAQPSYASEQISCSYIVRAVLPNRKSLFKRDFGHAHLSVVPLTVEYERAPHTLVLENESVKIEVVIDQVSLEAGEALTGSFLLTRLKPDGAIPTRLTVSLACIEELSAKGHRKILWRDERSVVPTAQMEYPLQGAFEFPIEATSPTTGDWITFKVHTGFRFKVEWADARDQRESLPIQVFHPIRPMEPARNL